MKPIVSVVMIALLMGALIPTRAFAQAAAIEEKPPSGGPRKQLATIIYAGLGGAVLGLSTLSFYGRPQDKLANIAIGFAVGVMAGTVVVTYNAMTNPDEFYGEQKRNYDEWRIAAVESQPFVLKTAQKETTPFSASFSVLSF